MGTASPHPPQGPERQAAQSLSLAALLAATGGYLDAFLYLTHGRVFAGAMTGNAVLFGIALLGGNGHLALHHFMPLLGFAVGVLLAYALEDHLREHLVTGSLLLEATALFAASWLPGGFPELVFVPVLAAVAAFQVTSFRKVDAYSYNATFITGNLRTAFEGAYQASSPAGRREGFRKLRDLGTVVLSFLAGVVAGSWLSHRLANRALWLPVALLLVVLEEVLRRRRRDRP